MKLKTVIKRNSVFFAVLFLFIACDKPHYFQQQKNLNGTWFKDSAVVFDFKIKDVEQKYDLSLILRNNDEYEFSNFYLFTKFVDPLGNEINDTLQYYLAYPDGKWVGNGINVKELILVYRESLNLKDTGDYKLTIWQGMRQDSLRGLEDISLIIDQTKLVDNGSQENE